MGIRRTGLSRWSTGRWRVTCNLQGELIMYASVRRYEGVTDVEKAARLVNEGFVPIISQVPGLEAYYLVDGGAGVLISVSVFSDQEGIKESNRRAADWVRENVAPLLPYPPRITAGTVIAHKP